MSACRLPALHMFDLCGGRKEGKSDLRRVHVTLKPQRRAPRWWKNITQTRWILTIEDNYARHSYFHQCPSSPTPPPRRLSRALCFFCFFFFKKQTHAPLWVLRRQFGSTRTKSSFLSAVCHTTLTSIIFTSFLYL